MPNWCSTSTCPFDVAFFLLFSSGRFVQGDSEGNSPCILASQHRVDAEAIADHLLTGRRCEVVLPEQGHSLDSQFVGVRLASHLLVLHVSQQDAGAQIEREHQQVEMRIETAQVLCVIVGEGLQDG